MSEYEKRWKKRVAGGGTGKRVEKERAEALDDTALRVINYIFHLFTRVLFILTVTGEYRLIPNLCAFMQICM